MSDFREMLMESAIRQRNWGKEARMVMEVRVMSAQGKRVVVVCPDKKQRNSMRKRYPDIAKCFIVPKPRKELKGQHDWIIDDPLFRHFAAPKETDNG